MLCLLASSLLLIPTAAATAPVDERPQNVLVILLDDVGLDQLAMYDDENAYPASAPYGYAQTPNLDALAQGGVRFTQARANPLCSPTRALLNSGRYAFRSGVGSIVRPGNASPSFQEFSVAPAPDERTLPEARELRDHATAWIGKWHLGLEEEDGGSGAQHPQRVGWQHFAGALHNLNQAPHPGPIELDGETFGPGYNHWYRTENGERTTETTYATVRQRLDCQDWILAQGGDPWLAVLAFSASHSPYDWPPDGTHGFPDLWPHGTGVLWDHYRAMLESVDHEVGELLFALGETLDDTLVIVLGDNGSPKSVLASARDEGQDVGLYGELVDQNRMKASVYEAGVRVPLFVSGVGVEGPGRSSDALVDVVDLHATIRAMVSGSRVEADLEDSRSFAGLLRTPTAVGARRYAFAERFDPNGEQPAAELCDRALAAEVLADGVLYKLVRRAGASDEVYDLTHDPLERSDLGPTHAAHAPLASQLGQLLVGT